VIAGGRIAWRGTPQELIERAGGVSIISFRLPDGLTPADLPADLGAPVTQEG
jgi:hypothetical protein